MLESAPYIYMHSKEGEDEDAMLYWPVEHLAHRLMDVDVILLDCRDLGETRASSLGPMSKTYHEGHSTRVFFCLLNCG